jgi:hypothetical protein
MRRLAVYLTLVVLLAVSLAAGYIASEWPRYCHRLGWCSDRFAPQARRT